MGQKTSFRIFGLCRKDARTGVGDFVRFAREIHKKDLSPDDISKRIREIGAGYTIDEAGDQLWDADCYTKWKDELRYLLYRYEEYLAERRGASVTNPSSGTRFGKNLLWIPLNTYYHNQKEANTLRKQVIFVHRLGNLLLLPPRVNSTLGGKDPEAKAEAYHGTRTSHRRRGRRDNPGRRLE